MKLKIEGIYIGTRRRQDYGTSDFDDLKKDMQENGQITSITVRPPNDVDRAAEDYEGQEWVLVAGGRRLMAAALLGWKEIEAFGREEMSEIKHRTLELSENIKRKAMTWEEEVAATKEIAELLRLQKPQITDAEIAKEIGVSPSTVSRDLKTAQILEQTPSLRTAGSKHAVLHAGKNLEEHNTRVQRMLSQQQSKPETTHVEPLEKRIVTDDAVSFARRLPTNSVDLMLLDGPYGYNYWKGGHKTKGADAAGEHLSSYDDNPERTGDLYRLLFPELVRATRETGWLAFFAGKETYDFLEDLAKDCCATHASYRHAQHTRQCEAAASKQTIGECRFLIPEPFPWIWHRPNSNNKPRYPNLHAWNMAELILVVNMGRGRIVKLPASNVLVHDVEYGSSRIHANQKPMSLYAEIVQRLTFAGDTVCDTFFGSGNSLAAAASLARVPIGCDKNPTLLQFAHAIVTRYQRLPSKDAIESSFSRYQQGLAREIIADPLAEEEGDDAAVAAPQVKTPPKKGIFQAEDARKVGERWISYIMYEGWNMGQKHGETEEEAYNKADYAADLLQGMLDLGLIDPSTETRDYIWQQLEKRWEEVHQ